MACNLLRVGNDSGAPVAVDHLAGSIWIITGAYTHAWVVFVDVSAHLDGC